MFEKTKVIRHLTNFEAAVGTSSAHRHAIAELASRTGIMERSVEFAKNARDAEFGAARLIFELCEMASETNPPRELMSAFVDLFQVALEQVEMKHESNPVVARILLTSALGIKIKLVRTLEKDYSALRSG